VPKKLAAALALLLLAGCAPSADKTIKVGALFPLTGTQAPLARQELEGVEIARDLVNAGGGVGGVPVQLLTRDLTLREDAGSRVDELQRVGARAIIGTYSSALSMPASEATQSRGLLYWESGAVADQLTGRGYPLVFRVGATGSNLGTMSSHFTAQVLAPRLHRTPDQLRMVVVHATDAYPASVAAAVVRQAGKEQIPVVGSVTYDHRAPDWPRVFKEIRSAQPDILVLASYIPDGVSFRRAMLQDGLHVQALIGSTMAQCLPDFGMALGEDAIGVFASDRPTSGFNPAGLNQTGRAAYDRFAAAYRARHQSEPTEDALAGFSAGWALFHYVMPAAQSRGDLSASGLAKAARDLDLPDGSLADGAGVRFAATADAMGQNLRASSVIWQWQGVRRSVTVYPPVLATGEASFIPLPR
jgi:branched-chain amino acid transport system substrate-binding protein